MRRTLALAVVLTVLAGAGVASVATAAPPERSSTLRPWGKGPASAQATAQATAEAATPEGATRLVVFGQEADFTNIDTAPQGDSPGDQQLTIEGVGLNPAVTGGTGRFKRARGQLHETFLPTGQFRFAFTLHL